ncbi:MAG: DUF3102 domain-containing protein [Limisphaerales bacterium]
MNSETKQTLNEYAATLNDLQAKIESADAIAIQNGKVALELAINAGTILRQAKGVVHYGTWKKWLAENVTKVTERTAQNWMKLAKHASILADCQSLNEAYLLLRIKKKPAVNPEGHNGDESETEDETKEQDAAQYPDKLSHAKSLMAQRVSGELQTAGVNWNVATWTIKNDRPVSDDGTNKLARTLHKLAHFVASRDHTTLDTDVETREKTKIVLNELLNVIIKASRPQQLETAENDSPCPLEVNTPPAEQMAA